MNQDQQNQQEFHSLGPNEETRNRDWEGLQDRSNDSQQQQDMDAQLFAVTEILGIIDKSPLLNTGQKLLLYWACGVPVPKPEQQPLDYAEIPLTWAGE